MKGLIFLIFLLISLVHSEPCGLISPVEVDLILVNGDPNKSTRVNLRNAVDILQDPNFNSHKDTAFYTFDFLEKFDSLSSFLISKAFIDRGDHNLIILDYGRFSGGNFYFDAMPSSLKVNLTIILMKKVLN